jgi:hypothetical protein
MKAILLNTVTIAVFVVCVPMGLRSLNFVADEATREAIGWLFLASCAAALFGTHDSGKS